MGHVSAFNKINYFTDFETFSLENILRLNFNICLHVLSEMTLQIGTMFHSLEKDLTLALRNMYRQQSE